MSKYAAYTSNPSRIDETELTELWRSILSLIAWNDGSVLLRCWRYIIIPRDWNMIFTDGKELCVPIKFYIEYLFITEGTTDCMDRVELLEIQY